MSTDYGRFAGDGRQIIVVNQVKVRKAVARKFVDDFLRMGYCVSPSGLTATVARQWCADTHTKCKVTIGEYGATHVEKL